MEFWCPQTVDGIVVDPQPDWSFNTLLSELTSIEKKLNASSGFPLPFTKIKSRYIGHFASAFLKLPEFFWLLQLNLSIYWIRLCFFNFECLFSEKFLPQGLLRGGPM